MSDYLSQDQIDSLLSGALDDGDGGGAGSSNSDMRYPALSAMFDLFCVHGESVVSTVLNKELKLTAELCEKADFSVIQEKLEAVVLSLSMEFNTGLTGQMYLIIQKKDVAVLSDLMMMGDGSADYNDDHKDAIGELFNQVMGAFSTAYGLELGQQISTGSIEVTEFDLNDPPFPPDSLDMAIAKLTVEDQLESHVALLIPEELATQITEKYTAVSGDSVGLNEAELDELSQVSSDFSDADFGSSSGVNSTLGGSRENIDLLMDINLDVSIELGRSTLSIKRILELSPGSIVELERMAGEPVDLLVNDKVVAKGEVVVVDESFGIRIVSLVSPEERIKSLR